VCNILRLFCNILRYIAIAIFGCDIRYNKYCKISLNIVSQISHIVPPLAQGQLHHTIAPRGISPATQQLTTNQSDVSIICYAPIRCLHYTDYQFAPDMALVGPRGKSSDVEVACQTGHNRVHNRVPPECQALPLPL